MMIDEQDYVTDDEVDEMYGDGQHAPQQAQAPLMTQTPSAGPVVPPMGALNGLPVYSLALAQVPPMTSASGDSLLTRKIGPLPVWGWALTAIGTGIGGYFLWQSNRKVTKNDGDEDDSRQDLPALPESTGSGSWSPSRGAFAQQVGRHFMRKGMAEKVKIYDDADEAKKKLKHVSPLINIKCDVSYKPDKELERLCKREGLSPIVHEDGTIGLYPAQSGKRATEWEKYIDLLREDGQVT